MDETTGNPESADLNSAARAYAETLRDFWSFVHELPLDEFLEPSELPGWSVQDIVSHIIGVEVGLLGRPSLEHTPDYASLPHVEGPLAQYLEVAVDARRGEEPEDVRRELDEILDDRIALLSAGVFDLAGPAATFYGSVERMLVMRPIDVWIHEQDLRLATERPGNLDGAGARVTWATVRSLLPFNVGKQVKPGPGISVRWEISGELPFTDTIVVGDDGRAAVAPDFDGEPTVTLTTDWATFALISSGRPTATPPTVSGDQDLAQRVLAASVVTP